MTIIFKLKGYDLPSQFLHQITGWRNLTRFCVCNLHNSGIFTTWYTCYWLMQCKKPLTL